MTTEILHICPLGHNYLVPMEQTATGAWIYASWHNNLCTVGNCDRVGIHLSALKG